MNDLIVDIAVRSVVLCAAVSVTVRSAVPFDHDRPLMVRYAVEPFLMTSVFV